MKLNKRIIAFCVMLAVLVASVLSVTADKTSGSAVGNIASDLKGLSAVEVRSSRHTQYDTLSSEVVNLLTLEGFEEKFKNENFSVYFNEDIAGIRILDHRNGYIWGSIKELEPDDLSTGWTEMAHSMCTVEYFIEGNVERKISISNRKARTSYDWSDDSVVCDVNFSDLGIAFSFKITLLPDGLRAEMVEDSLEETGEAKLKALYFLPFLGATREDERSGYLFVPDGAGALIRFTKTSSYVTGYSGKVFGLDMGIDTLDQANDLQSNRTNDYLVDTPQVTMPVFGVVHGAKQNAVFGVIESGEEHAKIVASPAGVVTNYFWATACFDFRQLYVRSTGTNQGVYQPQDEPDDITPSVRYYFLQGQNADYSGMAVTYREYLKENGVLSAERKDENIPLKLQVIGAEEKEGIFFNSTATFTTADQAKDMISALKKDGIENLTFVFDGWQQGGISGSDFASTKFESKIGSKGDFEELKKLVTKNGGRFYLQYNPVTANDSQIKPSRQAAMSKSNNIAAITRPNTEVMYQKTYFVKPELLFGALDKYVKDMNGFNPSFTGIGTRLYADYTRKNETSRLEALNKTIKYFDEFEKDIALSQPNQYLFPYVDDYFDIPTTNSQYVYETDTVPFLQIVLKGSVDYYASYANQGFYSTNSILKMLEYGCYPSFLVTEADNFSLSDTPLEDYFSLNFEDWRGTIKEVYTVLNSVLKQTEGQTITEHTVLATGVSKVTYSEGTVVYVNYNEEPFAFGDVTVPAQGYTVERR